MEIAHKTVKLSYVTDLHLSLQRPDRNASLIKKIKIAGPAVKAFIFGGDTFSLAGKQNWEPLINRPINRSELKERIKESRSLVDGLLPGIMEAANGRSVFMLQGNGDAIAFRYLTQISNKYPNLKLINNIPIEFYGYYIVGVGGIEPDNEDARRIMTNNPWYGGIINPSDYRARFVNLSVKYDIPWRKTIFMTHQPAFGYVDEYKGEHKGSVIVLGHLLLKNPIIHLAGHVHSAPVVEKVYTEDKISALIGIGTGDRTLSINPGGDVLHDTPDGVRMNIISLDEQFKCTPQEIQASIIPI